MSKKTIFLAGLWREHPNLRQLLGMCPTLAITTSVRNGFAMGTAVLFVLVFSSFMVALIKRLIPHQVRIAVYTIIIATFVTIADITLKAPAGSSIIIQGRKCMMPSLKPKIVPLPRISLTAPIAISPHIKPRLIPKASKTELPTELREAKASALPKIMQFTTISGT